MSIQNDGPASLSPYVDLFGGEEHVMARLRQFQNVILDETNPTMRGYIIVGLVNCLEWYARSKIKGLIDFSPELINNNAKILKELKINYSLILQSHRNQFTIGDIVAINRNFSSFKEIEEALFDLLNSDNSTLLSKLRFMIGKTLRLDRKYISIRLEKMFRARHEIVHGTPRHFLYEDEVDRLASKREIEVYIRCCIIYVKKFEEFMRIYIPGYNERSTRDMLYNQSNRLSITENKIDALEKSIEKHLIDSGYLLAFKKAQRAWRKWRAREAEFQSYEWFGGTMRNVIQLGEATSLNMQRIRHLENFLRQIETPRP